MQIPLYIILAFSAATFFALAVVLSKFASKHSIDNPKSLFAYFIIGSVIFALAILPFVNKTIPPIADLTNVFIAAVAFLLGFSAFYIGITKADASTAAPFLQLQAAFVALLAYIFLGERFPVINYAWIVLIMIGAILVSLDERMSIKSFLTVGVGFLLLMQVFHAISNLFIGFSLRNLGALEVLFWDYIVVGTAFIPYVLMFKPRLKYRASQIIPVLLATFISSIGALFLFKAFEQNLTISSTIGLLSSPIVLAISIAASKLSPKLLEHHTRKVYIMRTLGVVLILIGAVKLSLG